jgi:hypothetical protein
MMIKDRKDWFMFFRQYYINMHDVRSFVGKVQPKCLIVTYNVWHIIVVIYVFGSQEYTRLCCETTLNDLCQLAPTRFLDETHVGVVLAVI